jgi:NAD-dependent SIR2 family protein deacetylase
MQERYSFELWPSVVFYNMMPQIHFIQQFNKALNVSKLRIVKITLICVRYVKSANENLIPTTENIYWQLS